MGHMRTLFLNPPSFPGINATAAPKAAARTALRSLWYPIGLAQSSALIPNSKLIDARADHLTIDEVFRRARGFELCVIQTSILTFDDDAKVAAALKAQNAEMLLGFIGPHVAALPEESLGAAPAVDFIAGSEFDFTIRDISEGRSLDSIPGLTYRFKSSLHRTPERPPIAEIDSLPSVLEVYKRDLIVENYSVSYLKSPYLALNTGRGHPTRFSYRLWPHNDSTRRDQVKSAAAVIAEVARARSLFPQVKEIFFDDDMFTADLTRAHEIAQGLGAMEIKWSCTSRADIPFESLKFFKENGLRLLRVGYGSGNQKLLYSLDVKARTDIAHEFTRQCHELGIVIHGTFILGLPGETKETIDESIRYACALNVDTIQVSVPSTAPGVQSTNVHAPRLKESEIEWGVKRFYSKFYARPTPIFRMLIGMAKDPSERKRKLRDVKALFQFLRGQRGDKSPS